MRSFASPLLTVAVLAAASLPSAPACAETAAEPSVVCAAHSDAAPAKVIDSCAALIADPATADADRLKAMVVQALARHRNGDSDKALEDSIMSSPGTPELRTLTVPAAKSCASSVTPWKRLTR